MQTSNSVLPADVPPRFYLLVAGSVVALIGVGVVARAMKSLAVIVSGVVVIAAIFAQSGWLVSPT